MRIKEKFECYGCSCYFWVDDRNEFDCPNCGNNQEVKE